MLGSSPRVWKPSYPIMKHLSTWKPQRLHSRWIWWIPTALLSESSVFSERMLRLAPTEYSYSFNDFADGAGNVSVIPTPGAGSRWAVHLISSLVLLDGWYAPCYSNEAHRLHTSRISCMLGMRSHQHELSHRDLDVAALRLVELCFRYTPLCNFHASDLPVFHQRSRTSCSRFRWSCQLRKQIGLLHKQAARLFGLVFLLPSWNVSLPPDLWQLPSPFAVAFMADYLQATVSNVSIECVIKILPTSTERPNTVFTCVASFQPMFPLQSPVRFWAF